MEPLSSGPGSSTNESEYTNGEPVDPNMRLWGTTIHTNTFQDEFHTFLSSFIHPGADPGATPYYRDMLEHELATNLNNMTLNINCQHLSLHNARLFKQLVEYPAEVIDLMGLVAMGLAADILGERPDLGDFSEEEMKDLSVAVRPFGVLNAGGTDSAKMRDLRSYTSIEKLVEIHGLVTRVTKILPDMLKGEFECVVCRMRVSERVQRDVIREPSRCQNCNSQLTFMIKPNLSIFEDKQIVKLQEPPEDVREGQTPKTITAVVHGNLVDVVCPGDKIAVAGIFKAVAPRRNVNRSLRDTTFRTYVDAMSITKLNKSGEPSMGNDNPNAEDEFTPAEEESFYQLREKGGMRELLIKSLAPSIHAHKDYKEALLCQLVGGTKKGDQGSHQRRPDGDDTNEENLINTRSDLNVLMCGDPGVAKSQLLQFVGKITPRGQITTGKGTSSVGLTASVAHDPETGEPILESGALVLADRGICCIDEFDKMSEAARTILHEVMEQQTISVAKAGIICSLNARTSVLAAANPKRSHWDPNATFRENVNLPDTLISRFDLIFVLQDKVDEVKDKMLAEHIVNLYVDKASQDGAGDKGLDTHQLSRFVAYARNKLKPRLKPNSDAFSKLRSCYLDYRMQSSVGGGSATSRGRDLYITVRHLESLIRLSEAEAKLNLDEEVTTDHVEAAVRLFNSSLTHGGL